MQFIYQRFPYGTKNSIYRRQNEYFCYFREHCGCLERNPGPVSEKVEKPCRKIAMALESLSEISFVFPYTEKCPEKVCDIEIILQGKLGEPTGYGVSRKFSDNLSLNR